MIQKWHQKILGLSLCLLLASGCVATAVGVGATAGVAGYKWLEGNMSKEYPYPYLETWEATLAAVEHFRMKTIERRHTPLSGKIEAQQPDGTKVRVQVIAKPNNITVVEVRFGFMGNKDASLLFHQQIMKSLEQ